MAIAFRNSVAVVADYSKKWAIACRNMLEIKRPRTSIRAKWKKVGGGWQVVSATKKTFRGNYVASGQLVASIQPDPKGLTLRSDAVLGSNLGGLDIFCFNPYSF